MARKPKIDRFNEKILSRFQIYNSLFLTLPFKTIKQTSLFLPLLPAGKIKWITGKSLISQHVPHP